MLGGWLTIYPFDRLEVRLWTRVSTKKHNEQRRAEGIAAAKLRGVQFGRKPKEKPPEYPTVLEV